VCCFAWYIIGARGTYVTPVPDGIYVTATPDVSTPEVAATITGAWRLGPAKVAARSFDYILHVWDVSELAKPVGVRTLETPASMADVCPVSETTVAWVREEIAGEDFVEIIDLSSGDVRFAIGCGTRECTGFARNERKGIVAWIQQPSKKRFFRLRAADCLTGQVHVDLKINTIFSGSSMERMYGGLALSPNGRVAAFGTCSAARTLGAADLATGKLLWYRKNPEGGPWAIAFHPDGESFFIGTQGGWVVRYETASGKMLSRWGPITFKTDAGFLPRPTATAHARLLAIDVSPDGKYLAVDTEASHGVVIYDIATGSEFKKIRASEYPIEQALFFSADSKGIWAAGSGDTQLKYFKVAD
jgi:WD40 repeat protein